MPSASATSETFHDSDDPSGPVSHNKSARAWMNLGALVFPLRVLAASIVGSSSVRVTLYRGAIPCLIPANATLFNTKY